MNTLIVTVRTNNDERDWEKTPSQIKKPNDELILDSSFGFLYTQKIVPDMM